MKGFSFLFCLFSLHFLTLSDLLLNLVMCCLLFLSPLPECKPHGKGLVFLSVISSKYLESMRTEYEMHIC